MKVIKSILLNVFTGASATAAAAMVLIAYSDRFHPADYPILACAGMVFPFFLVTNLIILMIWLIVKWRRIWIPIVGFVLAFPAIRIYLPFHFHSEPPQGCIKVLSYNVNAYLMDKEFPHPEDSIFEYLRHQNADIVCLQEDIIQTSSHPIDYSAIYPYNDTVHLNKPTSLIINAIGIHTRYPILSKERISFKSEANGSVAFFLKIGNDTVIVINNHLESTHLSESDRERYNSIIRGGMSSEDAQVETRKLVDKLSTAMIQRASQAEAIHQYTELHNHYPAIICGDFNDTPISYVRRTIAKGLTDCYVETGNGVGVSYNQKGFYFRIDQIMCSRHFEPYNCYVDDYMKASDHYPIVCWLKKN